MPTFAIKRNDTLPIFTVQAIEKGTDSVNPIDLSLDSVPNAVSYKPFLTLIKARHEISAVNVPTIQALDANNYVLRLQIDNFTALSIDVTANEGATPQEYSIASVIENINTALSELDSTLSNVAREKDGKIILVSSVNTSLSRVIIHNDDQEVRYNCISQLFGIATNIGDVNSNEGTHRQARIVKDNEEITDLTLFKLNKGILAYQFTSTETKEADLFLAEFNIKYYNVAGSVIGKRSLPLSLSENLYVSILPDIDDE